MRIRIREIEAYICNFSSAMYVFNIFLITVVTVTTDSRTRILHLQERTYIIII